MTHQWRCFRVCCIKASRLDRRVYPHNPARSHTSHTHHPRKTTHHARYTLLQLSDANPLFTNVTLDLHGPGPLTRPLPGPSPATPRSCIISRPPVSTKKTPISHPTGTSRRAPFLLFGTAPLTLPLPRVQRWLGVAYTLILFNLSSSACGSTATEYTSSPPESSRFFPLSIAGFLLIPSAA